VAQNAMHCEPQPEYLTPSELTPRVHEAISILRRRMIGRHSAG
jgi:hypothetical protein